MNKVIPRIRNDRRKSYIEMYAKPQRGKEVHGYIKPRTVIGTGGVIGGYVSMGERKIEGAREDGKPENKKRGGAELKVEKKEYQMPPEPSLIIALKKKIAEEDRKSAEEASQVKREVKEPLETVKVSEPKETDVTEEVRERSENNPEFHTKTIVVPGEGERDRESAERAASLPLLEGVETDGRRERRRKGKHRHGM